MVYFVKTEGGNRVKIGYTKNSLEQRIASLQTGCPETLHLAHVIENASIQTESQLHKRFKKDRIRGEWFQYSQDIESFIKERELLIRYEEEKERLFAERLISKIRDRQYEREYEARMEKEYNDYMESEYRKYQEGGYEQYLRELEEDDND